MANMQEAFDWMEKGNKATAPTGDVVAMLAGTFMYVYDDDVPDEDRETHYMITRIDFLRPWALITGNIDSWTKETAGE